MKDDRSDSERTEASRTFSESVEFVLQSGAFLCFGAGFLGAIGILGYQVIRYLHSGIWIQLSVLDGFKHVADSKQWPWLYQPDTWIGLYDVFSRCPLALGIFVVGIALGWILIMLSE